MVIRFLVGLIFVLPGSLVSAQTEEFVQEQPTIVSAEIVEILDTGQEDILQLGIEDADTQLLRAVLLEGERKGESVEFENNYITVQPGDKVFLRESKEYVGDGYVYGMVEIERSKGLLWLFLLFAVVIIGFGGMQGVRSLLSLAASILIILYLLVPSLASGYPPILTSIGIATLILFGAIFITHGFNKRSLAAFLGTVIAITITGILAWISVDGIQLTGFGSDESVYLNLNTGGSLDFAGLLLGAIIIGVLGVLDDIAITQVAVVRELLRMRREHDNKESLREIYTRALRVGREHVAALVNTLVLAYTGAALPLLLWVSTASTNVLLEINREVFAAEIVRTLIGSIGLVMTVPITTAIALFLMKEYSKEELSGNGQPAGCAHVHDH